MNYSMNYSICGDFINKKKSNRNIETFVNIPEIGFIVTRHVNSEMTNKYWNESVFSIQQIYKNIPIVIIDDNSNYKYVMVTNPNINMTNCTIINSEFKGRGELLPYYYFYRYKWFGKAIIIHDSVFILQDINFNKITTVQFLWDFPANISENEQKEKTYISKLNHSEKLLEFYDNKKIWKGCFGVMSVITHDFISLLESKYYFFTLLYYIRLREDRCCLERIFAVLCNIENSNLIYKPSMFGSIYDFIKWGYTYNQFLIDKQKNTLNNYSIIKVWTGR